MPDRQLLEHELSARAGHVEIGVEPAAEGEPFMPIGQASLLLEDVECEVGDEAALERWRIDRLELDGIEVGWFAG